MDKGREEMREKMGTAWLRILFASFILLQVVRGNPFGSASGGSPLGSSPGGPQGPVPVGAGGDDGDGNSTTAGSSERFRTVSRSLDTLLAVLTALLMTVTYAVLIGPGTRLASTSKLPLASITTNIGNLLSRTWPDTSLSAQLNRTESSGDSKRDSSKEGDDAIRLLYVGKLNDRDGRTARGVEQCKAIPTDRIQTPPMWLTTGSSLTKSMVQLAVWEWVSIWMVVAMLISTLMFNGFLTNEEKPDRYPRLVVVVIYCLAFCVHAWYVWKSCRSFFTLLGAGATWSLLNKASFASVDTTQLKAGVSGGKSPIFRQTGKPAASATFPPYDGCLLEEIGAAEKNEPALAQVTDAELGAINTVNDWQKREIGSTVEAGRLALERVVTNVMAMVGITITTGFAVWTSMADAGDSTTQLGSLALLASLTIGSGAMFSSAVELSVMDTSFTNVLFLKEVMLNGQATAHVQKRANKKHIVGFTHNTVQMKTVGFKEMARSTGFWGLLIFGPAYGLLPSKEDHYRQSAGAKFELFSNVRGKKVLLTTEGTNRHNKHEDGGNFDTINVCYLPDPDPNENSSCASSVDTPFRATGKEV